MDETSASAARIEVLWRPGCPDCARLRRGLARAGIETVQRDIWFDPDAAARVRAATGGDETVPTVVVGTLALVNPSVAQVVSAVRAEFPDDAEALIGAAPVTAARPVSGGAVWTAVVALVWVFLAVWRPSTTWHFAPVLLAGAWPWVAGQDLRTGDRAAAGSLGWAGSAGLAVAALVTLGLSGAELLRGPAFPGFGGATSEALVLAGAGAVLAVLLGLLRVLRAPVTRSAWSGPQRVASSDDVVLVEGNAYFPASSVLPGALTPSATRTVCPWKGVARYFTVTVDGEQFPDAAWCYPRPLPLARRVKGRIAFERAVDVRPE